MNTWKEHLIQYVKSLDDSLLPEEAEELLLVELERIKRGISVKNKESSANNVADNHEQLNRPMGMAELITLYRELFYGRQDVFAVRWYNEKDGKQGYSPKCKNEWDRNICGKAMRIKGACKKVFIQRKSGNNRQGNTAALYWYRQKFACHGSVSTSGR